jgi:hypothetical protein
MHCWNFKNPLHRKSLGFGRYCSAKVIPHLLLDSLSTLEEWNGTDVVKRTVSNWRCTEWWKYSKSLRVLICQSEAGSRPVPRLMFATEWWQLAIQKWCDDNTQFYLIDIRNADVGRKAENKICLQNSVKPLLLDFAGLEISNNLLLVVIHVNYAEFLSGEN